MARLHPEVLLEQRRVGQSSDTRSRRRPRATLRRDRRSARAAPTSVPAAAPDVRRLHRNVEPRPVRERRRGPAVERRDDRHVVGRLGGRSASNLCARRPTASARTDGPDLASVIRANVARDRVVEPAQPLVAGAGRNLFPERGRRAAARRVDEHERLREPHARAQRQRLLEVLFASRRGSRRSGRSSAPNRRTRPGTLDLVEVLLRPCTCGSSAAESGPSRTVPAGASAGSRFGSEASVAIKPVVEVLRMRRHEGEPLESFERGDPLRAAPRKPLPSAGSA